MLNIKNAITDEITDEIFTAIRFAACDNKTVEFTISSPQDHIKFLTRVQPTSDSHADILMATNEALEKIYKVGEQVAKQQLVYTIEIGISLIDTVKTYRY